MKIPSPPPWPAAPFDPMRFGNPGDEISGYRGAQDADGAEFWYRCPHRNCIVYLRFDRQDGLNLPAAMKWALDNDATGVAVTHVDSSHIIAMGYNPLPPKLTSVPFVPVQDRAFNAADFRTIEFDALTVISSIARGVSLVEFDGHKYAYKFITQQDSQVMFEREFQSYLQIANCEGVPKLIAVVRRDGRIRGFLLTYIEGGNLAEEEPPRDALPDITKQIIEITAGLEASGFYHTDLKGLNILRRAVDGRIFIIDFAGSGTEGWYKEGTLHKMWNNGATPKEAIYILGKTIWELWGRCVPEGEIPETVPTEIRELIENCCVREKYDSIDEIKREYYSS